MKKLNIVFLAIFTTIFLSSCISNNFAINANEPVAILSVRGTLNVPWLEERDDDYKDLDGMITNSINKIFGKNNPEIQTAQDRINYADEQFAYLLETNMGITVIPKDKIINSKQYKAITPSIFTFSDTKIYADNYKKIDEIGSQKTKLLLRELNAKSTIFVTFTFNKKVVEGSKLKGQITASVTMDVDVYDFKGHQKIMDTFTADSSQLVEILKTNYDKDALVELFPEIIDLVINQFIVKYM